MESTPLTNLLIALIILLLAAAVYVAILIKNLRTQIARLSYFLYFEITRKADLIPQFLDKTGQIFPPERFAEIIDLRGQTIKSTQLGTGKKALEDRLWLAFGQLINTIHQQPELKNNLALLALEKDLAEADRRVAEHQQVYNQTVNKYNKIVGNFLLKPVGLLVGAGKLETF